MRSKAILVVIVAVIAVVSALVLGAATPAKKKTAAKGSTAKTSTAKTSKSKTAKSKATKKSAAKPASSKQTTARYRRSTQREPAPERYKEIQQSLADKGYYTGSVNGTWGPDSVAALKRFQRDQNIGDDGKIGSLSLMALGLGPKRAP